MYSLSGVKTIEKVRFRKSRRIESIDYVTFLPTFLPKIPFANNFKNFRKMFDDYIVTLNCYILEPKAEVDKMPLPREHAIWP